MSYLDRLRQGKLISPEGNEFIFEFDYPNRDVADVQDLGNAIDTLPMVIYFSGRNYDLIADNFRIAIKETGVSQLEHPRFGNLQVQVSSFLQDENFVNGMGRAVFTINFIIVDPAIVFPSNITTIQSEVGILFNAFISASSLLLLARLRFSVFTLVTNFKSFAILSLNIINSRLRRLTQSDDVLQSDFDNLYNSILQNIDNLIDDPDILASNTTDLIRLSGKSTASLSDKTSAFSLLIKC